jgi:hypothetical protein
MSPDPGDCKKCPQEMATSLIAHQERIVRGEGGNERKGVGV